jgi:hypothetical protein
MSARTSPPAGGPHLRCEGLQLTLRTCDALVDQKRGPRRASQGSPHIHAIELGLNGFKLCLRSDLTMAAVSTARVGVV